MSTEHTCDECGESFSTPQGLGSHKSYRHSDNQEEHKDPDTLRELYHEKGMSTYEIADKFNVAATTIGKYMKEAGVEREKSYADATRPPSHLLDPHGDGVGNSYEKIRTHHNGERSVVLLHRLIAYAYGKLDFGGLCDSETVVHHKSGHGLDNRPSNLEVKSFKDHATDHSDERYGGGGWRDKERLKQLLENHTQKKTAEILGCTPRTIYDWKKKHGLE